MRIELVNGKSPIGQTIRAVSEAQSSRLFKSETNTNERSALVFMVIRGEVALALFDQGLTLDEIMRDIDPTDDVLAAMINTGYDVGLTQLLGEVGNE